MIFRQFLDLTSFTCTYLLASRASGEALLIDPVKEQVAQYSTLLEQLGMRLVYAIDTHTHADHVTALGALRETTGCVTIMGHYSQASCVSQKVQDGEILAIDNIRLQALYTPGHTNESFSFVLNPDAPQAVFTGDALLIRSSGRTDFQGGDAGKSWDSITEKLFRLPDDTSLYPGHDYQGWLSSSIGEEKRYNPRLAGKTRTEYIAIMDALDLPHPRLMDIAIPANLACGQ